MHGPCGAALLWACGAAVLLCAQGVPLECRARSGPHLHTPLFHGLGRMLRTPDGELWPLAATDANAIFGAGGQFHAMHQTPNATSRSPSDPTVGYHASWGHLVSRDLARWRRVPNALDPSANSSYDWHDGDCDGTVSLEVGRGVGTLMTFGPDCARPVANDAPRVAIARPVDSALVGWLKDPANPIRFDRGSPPCAFSGQIWAAGRANFSMICAVNALANSWGRYSSQALLGPWALQDPSFASTADGRAIGSISAPSFLPLGAGAEEPTHMINAAGGRGYAVGWYNSRAQKLNVRLPVQMVESMGSHANWFVAGLDNRTGRVLHLGFLQPRDMALCYDFAYSYQRRSFCPLTLPRVLRWAPEWQQLVAQPPVELAKLRNASLVAAQQLRVAPGQPIWLDRSAASMDLELAVALGPGRLELALDVLASNASLQLATQVSIELSAAGGPRRGRLRLGAPRLVNHSGWAPWGPMESNFTVRPSEQLLELRVLVDRSIVEAFGAGGRAVVSARDFPGPDETGARLRVPSGEAVLVKRLASWSMGCGWEEDA